MAISPEDPAIEVKKLCFSYQGNNSEGVTGEQTLEDVDLHLPQGARCLLIGANGCESAMTMATTIRVPQLNSYLFLPYPCPTS